MGVFEGGALFIVRTDHIGRPVLATDMAGAVVWEASYLPFGGVHVSTGAPVDLRFPGQWFQAESGLHQNWMRDYDPALGRYLQADPLGLVDGAGVYGYALQNPGRWTDPRGEESTALIFYRNYRDMKRSNWRDSDKYFHCKSNCEATQCNIEDGVVFPQVRPKAVSILRELTDLATGDSLSDWASDSVANSAGRNGAMNFPQTSCAAICSRFRPGELPTNY